MRRDIEAAYHCAAESVRARVNAGRHVPHWLHRHFQQLELEFKLSRGRHETDSYGEEFETQDRWIGTAEAAAILTWNHRQVQRLAADLDGQLVSGRWMFREATVIDYAEAKRDGDSRSGTGRHARSA